MNQIASKWLTVSLLLMAGIFQGCAPKIEKEVQFLEIDDFNSYVSISRTTPSIQNASLAVVRINKGGTGFFVSDKGHMMTNNHIIGRKNCALTGCFIRIDFKYQNNITYSKDNSQVVFAKPLSTSEEFDFTLVRLFEVKDGQAGEALSTPDFLPIVTRTAKELLNKKAFVVGHPLAKMKKVKTMTGYTVANGFIRMDDYVFGGNSGSPMLNAQGQVIGILHSGVDSSTTIARSGIQGYSNGTASKDFLELMQTSAEGLKDIETQDQSARDGFIDIDSEEFDYDLHSDLILTASRLPLKSTPIRPAKPSAEITDAEAQSPAAKPAKEVDKTDAPVVEKRLQGIAAMLKKSQESCEKVVDTNDVDMITYNDMIATCFAKSQFISCDSEQPFLYCPQEEEKNKWTELAEKIYQKNLTAFSRYSSSAVSLLGKFITDKKQRNEFTQQKRQEFVEKTSAVLSFELAADLIFSGLADYKAESFEQTPAKYILDFRSNKFHAKSLLAIGQSHLGLYQLEVITSPQDIRSVFQYLLGHRDLTARDRFTLEGYAYENRILQIN